LYKNPAELLLLKFSRDLLICKAEPYFPQSVVKKNYGQLPARDYRLRGARGLYCIINC